MKKCTLLAGKGGLTNEIIYLDSIEISDIAPWIRKGAGIAVKTRFIGQIPKCILEEADALDIPLFEIPAYMPIADITMPVTTLLVNSIRDKSSGEKLLHELLSGSLPSEEAAVEKAQALGWPHVPYSLMMTEIDGIESFLCPPQSDSSKEDELVRVVRNSFKIKSLFLCEGMLIYLLPHDFRGKDLEETVQALSKELAKRYGVKATTGIVNDVKSYLSLKEALAEAQDAITIGKAVYPSKPLIDIGKERAEQAFLHLSHMGFCRLYYSNTIGRLSQYDAKNGTHLLPSLPGFPLSAKTETAYPPCSRASRDFPRFGKSCAASDHR